MLEDTMIQTNSHHPPRNPRPKTPDPRPTPKGRPPSPIADCRIPNPDLNDSLLLRELLDPDLSPLDLCDHHELTLEQLEEWMNSPKIAAALDSLARIESHRRELITQRAQTAALAALEDLAALPTSSGHIPTAPEQLRHNETRRKAAAQLLRSQARSPATRATNRCSERLELPTRATGGSSTSAAPPCANPSQRPKHPESPSMTSRVKNAKKSFAQPPKSPTLRSQSRGQPVKEHAVNTRSIAVLTALAAPLTPALADDLLPVVNASIHDEPRDGLGDSFNNSPFEGLLRVQSHRADRATTEYDLSAFAGGTVTSATIHGAIFNNNAGGDFPRVFEFLIYSANGQRDLSDYQIDAVLVGEASWPAPSPPLDFSFDVAQAVQDVLDSGATFVGFRVQGISDNLFPSILDEFVTLTIEASAGCAADIDGDGDADADDFFAYLDLFVICDPNGTCDADIDGDGDADADDFFAYLDLFVAGCP